MIITALTILQTRNVLVGQGGLDVVKLGDMGLARTVTSSPYYMKTSNDKVVVKSALQRFEADAVCRFL